MEGNLLCRRYFKKMRFQFCFVDASSVIFLLSKLFVRGQRKTRRVEMSLINVHCVNLLLQLSLWFGTIVQNSLFNELLQTTEILNVVEIRKQMLNSIKKINSDFVNKVQLKIPSNEKLLKLITCHKVGLSLLKVAYNWAKDSVCNSIIVYTLQKVTLKMFNLKILYLTVPKG